MGFNFQTGHPTDVYLEERAVRLRSECGGDVPEVGPPTPMGVFEHG